MIWSEDELNRYGLPEDDDDITHDVIKPKPAITILGVVMAIIVLVTYLLS